LINIVLALDRVANIVVSFEIDQPLQPIAFGESCDKSRTMLVHPTDDIVGHADVENAVRTVALKISVSTCHANILQDGREAREDALRALPRP
jgi:hypothetical protein